MIKKIQITNYKSIDKLEFEPGRVNVLIGENGAGKSNILEAIALAGAAAADKLDNEFLASRGIRVTRPEYMRPAFPGFHTLDNILVSLESRKSETCLIELSNQNSPYSKWAATLITGNIDVIATKIIDGLFDIIRNNPDSLKNPESEKILFAINSLLKGLSTTSSQENKKNVEVKFDFDTSSLLNQQAIEIIDNHQKNNLFFNFIKNFIIFSPENIALRTFQREGQIEPLGINGEGLLKLFSVLSRPEYSETLEEIKTALQVLGWFEDLRLTEADPFAGSRIEIKDRYLDESRCYFDQLSTNEGFLFLLFYFALFATDLTPRFFAIDNIDASLNPKLCEKLMRELVKLAEKHDKQVILTTHNPAILDGLNVDDEDQRLFVVSRNANGATRMKRVKKLRTTAGERPVRLSEMFLRGILGGLPKEF